MTLLTELKHKQILVLGAGLTGLSCVRFLHAQGLCFAVNDSREAPFNPSYNEAQFIDEFPNANLTLGQWDTVLIANAEVILVSPGIDVLASGIAKHINKNCQVLGDVELFCQINNSVEKPISLLAVTGSNGKSTVVSLLDHVAKSLGFNSQLGGNIGQPVLDLFTQEKQPDLLILELSSFQLETLKSMQAIAATVLNVSDDHLDRHLNIDNYQAIKQGIYQQANIAIINRDDVATNNVDKNQKTLSFGSDVPKQGHFGVAELSVNALFVKGKQINKSVSKKYLMFGEQALIALDDLPLAGMHNALNYLATLALGYSAGWSLTSMVENLAGFSGLAHRCQRVSSNDNICWINDSKATNVGATLAAISGLSQTMSANNQLILIAGGDGKGADFSPLNKPLQQHVSQLITLGKDGDKIAQLVADTSQVKTIAVTTMEQAVQVASTIANTGDMVLLSPACASLDMFKNFAQRGQCFTDSVQQLAEAS